MAGLGWQELLVVLVIVMIIFGAGKLPEIARSLGQGVKAFKQEAAAPIAAGDATTQHAAAEAETTIR
jgi:sec-independent protein translocase protein TatA